MDLTDAIHDMLLRANEAVHLLSITRGMIQLGLVPDESKESQRIVYAAIINDIARNGENSRFRRGGRAMFVASDNYNPIQHAVKSNKIKKSEDKKYGSKVRDLSSEERRCGNCRHISWSGPGFLHQTGGGCGNQEKSGLWYVQVNNDACPYWRQRSAEQLAADKRERERDLIEFNKVNITMRGKTRKA